MAISTLSQASALNPGSDLWIVPNIKNSRWTANLDWYLNFQISKALRHDRVQLSAYTEEVLLDTELERVQIDLASTSPLMIASHNHLPNKWVVIVQWQQDLEAWVKQAHQIWSQLREPSLRFFLPPGQSAGSFQREWKALHNFEDFTVVLD